MKPESIQKVKQTKDLVIKLNFLPLGFGSESTATSSACNGNKENCQPAAPHMLKDEYVKRKKKKKKRFPS